MIPAGVVWILINWRIWLEKNAGLRKLLHSSHAVSDIILCHDISVASYSLVRRVPMDLNHNPEVVLQHPLFQPRTATVDGVFHFQGGLRPGGGNVRNSSWHSVGVRSFLAFVARSLSIFVLGPMHHAACEAACHSLRRRLTYSICTPAGDKAIELATELDWRTREDSLR